MKLFAWISVVVIGSVGCGNQVEVDRGVGNADITTETDAPASVVSPPAQNPFQASPAKTTKPAEDVEGRPAENEQVIDTSYLLSGTGAVLVINPDYLLGTDVVKGILKQIPLDTTAVVRSQLGFEPEDIDQVVVAWYPVAASAGAVILRFHRPYNSDELRKAGFWRKFSYENRQAGHLYYTQSGLSRVDGKVDPDSITPSLSFVDERTILFGYESMITKMVAAKNERSPLIDALRTMESGHAAIWISHGIVCSELFANLFAERSVIILLQQVFGGGDDKKRRDERFSRIPKPLWKFGEVLEREDSVLSVALDVDSTIDVHTKLAVTGEGVVQKAAIESSKAIEFARERLKMSRQSLKAHLALFSGKQELSAFDELLNTFDELLRSPVKQSHSNTVTLDLKGSEKIASLVVANATLFARYSQANARAVESRSKLHNIVIGLHQYHDFVGHFPPVGSRDKKGKLLLSWRVHLLPQIGEEDLYKEFRLDEAWDSDHNLSLVQRIPTVFRLPKQNKVDGKTHYLGVAGKGTLFGHPTGARFRDVTDGDTKTIAVVCVDDNSAVPWTKPVDFVFDPKSPAKGLGMHFREGFDVALVDGSVRRFESTIAPDMLRALFTIGAGD